MYVLVGAATSLGKLILASSEKGGREPQLRAGDPIWGLVLRHDHISFLQSWSVYRGRGVGTMWFASPRYSKCDPCSLLNAPISKVLARMETALPRLCSPRKANESLG